MQNGERLNSLFTIFYRLDLNDVIIVKRDDDDDDEEWTNEIQLRGAQGRTNSIPREKPVVKVRVSPSLL